MGLNFYICCHKCKERIFMFRGRESTPMHDFYQKHYNCHRASPRNLEIIADWEEPAWNDDLTGYEKDIELEIKSLPKFLKLLYNDD